MLINWQSTLTVGWCCCSKTKKVRYPKNHSNMKRDAKCMKERCQSKNKYPLSSEATLCSWHVAVRGPPVRQGWVGLAEAELGSQGTQSQARTYRGTRPTTMAGSQRVMTWARRWGSWSATKTWWSCWGSSRTPGPRVGSRCRTRLAGIR